MNSNKIREGIGFIDEDLIADAIEYTRTKKKNGWMKWAAMAACLCFVVTLTIPLVFDRGQSSEPAMPGGVIAEIVEVIDSNKWKVLVAGADGFHSKDDVLYVTLENATNMKTDFSLQVGDKIAITYNKHDIVEHKDGSIEILVSDIEIVD